MPNLQHWLEELEGAVERDSKAKDAAVASLTTGLASLAAHVAGLEARLDHAKPSVPTLEAVRAAMVKEQDPVCRGRMGKLARKLRGPQI